MGLKSVNNPWNCNDRANDHRCGSTPLTYPRCIVYKDVWNQVKQTTVVENRTWYEMLAKYVPTFNYPSPLSHLLFLGAPSKALRQNLDLPDLEIAFTEVNYWGAKILKRSHFNILQCLILGIRLPRRSNGRIVK